MSDSGSVEIRITGAVDSSLTAAAAQANATIGTVGKQADETTRAMNAALKATGGDLTKITPEMLGIASSLNTVAASAQAVKAAVGDVSFATLQEGINASLGMDRALTSAAASAKVFQTSLSTNAGFDALTRDRAELDAMVAAYQAAEAASVVSAAEGQRIANSYAGVNTEFKSAAESAALFGAALAPQASQAAMAERVRLGMASEAEAAAAVGTGLAAWGQNLRRARVETEGLNFATSGMIQEYVRMGRAISTGRFDILPSELATSASRMGGLTGATLSAVAPWLAVGAAVTAAAAAWGYLAYQEHEVEAESHKLADAFALTNRAQGQSQDLVRAEINYLEQLGGVTRSAAESFESYVATHASIDPVIAEEVSNLLPRFIEMLGKQGPEAAAKLAEELSNLTESGFRKLDHELLNLDPITYQTVQRLIEMGDEAQATDIIIKQLNKDAGTYFKTLGDKVYDAQESLKAWKASLAAAIAAGPDQAANASYILNQIQLIEDRLKDLREKEKAGAIIAEDNQYKKQLDDLKGIVEASNQRLGIEKKLDEARKTLTEATERGDSQGASKAFQAAMIEEGKLVAFDQAANEKLLRNFVTGQDATVAATKSGSAERIQVIRNEIERAKQLGLEGSDAYNELQKKLGDAQRTGAERGAREGAKAAKEAKEAVIRSLEEEANAARQGSQERIDADQKWLDYAKKAVGERSQQAHTANDALIRDERALVDQQIRDALAVSQEQVKAANDTASTQMKALEQVAKYSSMTAEEETAQALEIERVRDKAVNDSLNVALKAAGTNANAQRTVNKEIENEATEHQKRLDDITRQGLDLQVQEWSRFNQRITSAEDELVGDIFSANQSLWTSLRQVGLHFLEQMVADDIKYWTERELLAAEGVGAENAAEHGGITDFIRLLSQKTAVATTAQAAQTTVTVTGQTVQTAATASGTAAREAIGARENASFIGRIFSQLARWLGLEGEKTTATAASTASQVSTVTAGEAAKTGAVAAGTAAQTAIKTAGAVAGNAAEATADSTSILNSAYTAAASAFKWVMQEVPFPLNAVLAPVAAGVTFAAVAAFDVISAEGGAERIGADGQVVIAHRDESVFPARIAVPFMSFADDLPYIADMARNSASLSRIPLSFAPGNFPDLKSIADVGSLLPVGNLSATARGTSGGSASMSDADYLASKVGGGGRPSQRMGGGGITINVSTNVTTMDSRSFKQLQRDPKYVREQRQHVKDLVRRGMMAK